MTSSRSLRHLVGIVSLLTSWIGMTHCGPVCSTCPPGTRVVQQCNATHGTECGPCESGYYSNKMSITCSPCGDCGQGTFELSPCLPSQDTVCVHCSTSEEQHMLTENYRRQCVQNKASSVTRNTELFTTKARELTQKEKGAGQPVVPIRNWGGSKDEHSTMEPPPSEVEDDSMDSLLQEEGFLPESVLARDESSRTGQSVTYESRERLGLTDFLDATGSGSGSGDSLDFSNLDKKSNGRIPTKSDREYTKSDTNRFAKTGQDTEGATQASKTPFVTVTKVPRVDFATGNILSKKAKVALIVSAVLIGALATIVCGFLCCKLKRHQGKNHKNVYIPADIDRVTDARPKKNADFEPEEKTPLGGRNGVLVSSVGRYESSIDITHGEVTVDTTLRSVPLQFIYTKERNQTVSNTGSTVQISFEDKRSVLRGGPLVPDKIYRLAHCHFHWGARDSQGSEHTVEGKHYPAEVHLVHWNGSDYKSLGEAARSPGGLAVMAVFVEIGSRHEALHKVTDSLHNVTYKGQTVNCAGFDGASLIPENKADYWTYKGSCLAPPHHEAVTWVVFREPIEISENQMEAFRKLHAHEQDEGHDSIDNFIMDRPKRPQAPSANKNIMSSFI